MITNHLAPSFKKIHSNHKILDEWCINHKSKKIFLCISKCASRSMVDCLSKLPDYMIIEDPKITKEDILSFKDYKFYAIVRDPKKRYISGLNFFISHFSKGKMTETNKKQIENFLKSEKFIFDEHTLPQSFLLKKVTKYYEIELIRMERSLNKKLSISLGEKIVIPKLNSHKDNKINYVSFCNRMYEKYCLNNINFFKIYEKDYQLYERGY
jgi:hypothetical protein